MMRLVNTHQAVPAGVGKLEERARKAKQLRIAALQRHQALRRFLGYVRGTHIVITFLTPMVFILAAFATPLGDCRDCDVELVTGGALFVLFMLSQVPLNDAIKRQNGYCKWLEGESGEEIVHRAVRSDEPFSLYLRGFDAERRAASERSLLYRAVDGFFDAVSPGPTFIKPRDEIPSSINEGYVPELVGEGKACIGLANPTIPFQFADVPKLMVVLEHWKPTVWDLISASETVVIVVDSVSESITYELCALVEQDHAERTEVVLGSEMNLIGEPRSSELFEVLAPHFPSIWSTVVDLNSAEMGLTKVDLRRRPGIEPSPKQPDLETLRQLSEALEEAKSRRMRRNPADT